MQERQLTEDERREKRSIVRHQFRQAKGNNPCVDCMCGRKRIPLRFMYRCYYCGEFYCGDCAPKHFGGRR